MLGAMVLESCRVSSWRDALPADEAARCIANPPGFDREGLFRFYTGDGYC
jgi:hypothetical protein